jgi:hypothetical protein
MSCENGQCSDPRLFREVGDLIYYELFTIAILLEILTKKSTLDYPF